MLFFSKYHKNLLLINIFIFLIGCQLQEASKVHGILYLENRIKQLNMQKNLINHIEKYTQVQKLINNICNIWKTTHKKKKTIKEHDAKYGHGLWDITDLYQIIILEKKQNIIHEHILKKRLVYQQIQPLVYGMVLLYKKVCLLVQYKNLP